MKSRPTEITVCSLQVVVMPNGEIICNGHTLPFRFDEVKQYLSTYEDEDVCPDCNGTGKVFIEAYQSGGSIVEATEMDCACKVEARAELSANNEIDR
jgi:hypothetical protein